MKMTFRYYGEGDPVSLSYISQIQPVTGVVSAVYGVPVGEVWPHEKIAAIKKAAESHGLEFEVVESIPVHEDIKMGLPTRDTYIAAYKENLRRVAKAGVKCVCYNFMPVFDWLRTNLKYPHSSGAYSLAYDHEELLKLDPLNLHLPGWDESYKAGELQALVTAYQKLSEEDLFQNLVYFLSNVLPVAEEVGVRMAIHPDDPPWGVFGIPRIIKGEEDFDRLFAALPSMANGITFCTGSLGANPKTDLVKLAGKYAKRIPFAHLRQLTHTGEGKFYENGHLSGAGNVDIIGVVRALTENGFDGYVRPDHGRSVFGEAPGGGYGLYDRAMGACYLQGLFEGMERR